MRILVTGASGAYGSCFARLCLEKGHEVFSIRHLQRPQDSASLLGITDKITWATGDIRDSSFLGHCLASWEIQAVAHFAALPLVRLGMLVAEPIFSVNVMGTVALLDAVKQVGMGRDTLFLATSTDKVYGDAGQEPYTEDTPLRGAAVYEASKVAAEAACRAYQTHGFVPNLVISRSCNVVAPADLNWRLISNTVRQFVCGVPAKVYTSHQPVREFIHVEDSVEAQYLLMLRAAEFSGQAFNIGSGHQWTQSEAIEHIHRTHFPDGLVERVAPPPHHRVEIAYQRLDCTKIERALGWRPQRTVEQAVADVVNFWRARPDLARWSML